VTNTGCVEGLGTRPEDLWQLELSPINTYTAPGRYGFSSATAARRDWNVSVKQQQLKSSLFLQ